MADIFNLTAQARTEFGKSATRKLRNQEDRAPAVIYGAGKKTINISLSHKDIWYALEQEAVYSHILKVNVDGKIEQVVLKAVHRHPSRQQILHVDFLRIKAKEKLTMNVPIHFLNEEEAPGVKDGGVVSKHMTEVEIRCLPADLPESIDVDISHLELDQVLHLSDLKLPAGVELAIGELDEEHDQALVSIHIPKEEPEPEVEEAAEAEAEIAEGEEAVAEGEGEEEAETKPKESDGGEKAAGDKEKSKE